MAMFPVVGQSKHLANFPGVAQREHLAILNATCKSHFLFRSEEPASTQLISVSDLASSSTSQFFLLTESYK